MEPKHYIHHDTSHFIWVASILGAAAIFCVLLLTQSYNDCKGQVLTDGGTHVDVWEICS